MRYISIVLSLRGELAFCVTFGEWARNAFDHVGQCASQAAREASFAYQRSLLKSGLIVEAVPRELPVNVHHRIVRTCSILCVRRERPDTEEVRTLKGYEVGMRGWSGMTGTTLAKVCIPW